MNKIFCMELKAPFNISIVHTSTLPILWQKCTLYRCKIVHLLDLRPQKCLWSGPLFHVGLWTCVSRFVQNLWYNFKYKKSHDHRLIYSFWSSRSWFHCFEEIMISLLCSSVRKYTYWLPFACVLNCACHSTGRYWGIYPGALYLSQVTTNHLNIGHPQTTQLKIRHP